MINEVREKVIDIEKFEKSITDLIDIANSGNMSVVDTTLINTMNEKIWKEKESLVLDVLTNDIQKGKIKKKGKTKEYYQVRIPELNKIPRSYSYEGLIERVYELLFDGNDDDMYTIDSIFKMALDEKTRIKDSKLKTIQRDICTYNLFITDEFKSKDIRDITYTDICVFIQERLKEIKPTKHGLIDFKCILNLIFLYAFNPDHQIIDKNPVPSSNQMFMKNITVKNIEPEEKAFQPNEIALIRETLKNRIPSVGYNAKVNSYAIIFSTYTGLRIGELCSLKWRDIEDNRIHIHSQMINDYVDHKRTYKYEDATKNEKGYSKGGRYYPIFPEVREVLNELKALQKAEGIDSEWVFARQDGTWMTTQSYSQALNKLCHGVQYMGKKGLGLNLSNNHAIRMYVNSYLLDEKLGIAPASRAKLLGHSVQTNLSNYTFGRTDEFINDIIDTYNNVS